jgi:hypothetical protein
MHILVFKTNIADKKEIRKLSPFLKTIEGIIKWNVDLHDEDKILRIVTPNLAPAHISTIVQQAGYHCSELED